MKRINQGEIYWVQLDGDSGIESSIPHPYVVIQNDLFNHSRIHTVVVCPLTTNLNRIQIAGNVMLDDNEANLTKQSVVEVSKVLSVNKSQLGDYVGTLDKRRIKQILDGMSLVQRSFFS